MIISRERGREEYATSAPKNVFALEIDQAHLWGAGPPYQAAVFLDSAMEWRSRKSSADYKYTIALKREPRQTRSLGSMFR
jgi:hypothetical protein